MRTLRDRGGEQAGKGDRQPRNSEEANRKRGKTKPDTGSAKKCSKRLARRREMAVGTNARGPRRGCQTIFSLEVGRKAERFIEAAVTCLGCSPVFSYGKERRSDREAIGDGAWTPAKPKEDP